MLLLTILGCQSLPNPTTAPATQSAVVAQKTQITKNQILVQFETMDCPCNLGDINAALMELPGVSSLKWDYNNDRVFLNFLDDRRPTDEEIKRSLRFAPIVIKRIERP